METKYLVIRNTIFDDCKYFADWEKSPELTKFLSIDDDISYEQITIDFIRGELDRTKAFFTIIFKETNEPIGRIYLSRIDEKVNSCDITKVYIGEDAMRGKGYGEEVLRAMLDYCFINQHMERVTLDHFTGNKAANLYLKLGFEYEGIARSATKKNGKYYDLHLMSLLRADYYEKVHAK